ncbi:MAG TPA: alkaline phosphatase family protein [Gemmatimonadaceae bacterium]|nr:alkaline phosphatase family protein [Gemmatimonadaceae bacterium]
MLVSADRAQGPVVLLGFDAADPELVERWASEGKLPSIARLMERGAWARTSGAELLFEHGIWTSIFSGVSTGRHGFHFFWQPVPGSYALELKKGRDIGVSPFWAQLAGTGRTVLVMDPPDTEPVRGLAGLQVSEWATHSHYPPLELMAEPRSAVREVRRIFGKRQQIGETIGSTPQRDREMVERLVARAARKGATIRTLLEGGSYDVVVAVFAESHTGAHQVWEYRRDAKGDGPRDADGLGDGLLRLYQAVDAEIGRIADVLPASANVFVVSSVGLLSQYPTEALMEAFCRELGYQASPERAPAAGDAPAPRRSPTALLRGLLPAWARDVVNRFLPLGAQARLLSEKFAAATDWSRTTAYAPPGYYTGCIRVNLRGREPNGIVEPGAEYDAVLARLEQDLHTLVDAETGAPVIERTVRAREVFGDSPHPALPDLVVFWHAHDRPLRRLRHANGELAQAPHPFHRGSHHTTEGLIVAAGPDIRPGGRMEDVNPLAIAPTLLALLRATQPDSMTAAPLGGWLVSSVLGAPEASG